MFWVLLFIILFLVLGYFSNAGKRNNIKLQQAQIDKLRKCPTCAERVQLEAKKCRFCNEKLDPITNEELIEIEKDYRFRVASLDYDTANFKVDNDRKEKNKLDWDNNSK
ncbi:hypothetical protein [Photobacterium sp. GB-210]|uniref:hypothetical protein n=1 Tax=Photobacterium sp. GB-210 TaxID=2022104 RepID=UPI000D173EA1|nr:hypothetical protein [Photobacterium sp. GB-210]PSV41059.1 hypothetical protein C9J38_03205 [Photobacterium sp. GB-210]